MATEIKKKISIFMPTLFGAGGQRSMLNLAHDIADKNYPIDLVLTKIKELILNQLYSEFRSE